MENIANRALVACDVANLWKSCREEFGDNARVDFQVLGQIVPTITHEDIAQKLIAYIVTNPRQKHHAFESALKGFGYEIRERFLRYEKGLSTPFRTDWDVGITIDAIALSERYDTFVLVSGDGDFAMLLDHLKALDKKTIVLTFAHSSSKLLHAAADRLFYFSEDIVYRQPGGDG